MKSALLALSKEDLVTIILRLSDDRSDDMLASLIEEYQTKVSESREFCAEASRYTPEKKKQKISRPFDMNKCVH